MTQTCDCGGKIIGVEYAPTDKYHYDGVSEWVCMSCGKRTGRWCDKELTTDEVEPQYCKGRQHPRIFLV